VRLDNRLGREAWLTTLASQRSVILHFFLVLNRQADFFCGMPNGISFPYCSSGIRFVAFLKPLGTWKAMIFAINHLASGSENEVQELSFQGIS
jgi:hypothetical protein